MGSTLSVLASVAIIRSSINEFVPSEIRGFMREYFRSLSSELTMVVKESHEGSTNHLFNALVTYLGTNASSESASTQRVTVGKNESMKSLTFGLDGNSKVVDTFKGAPMKWMYHTDINSNTQFELRWFELRFHKQYKVMVKDEYLPHILDVAKGIKDQNKVVKFFTTRGGRDGWSSKGINLDHPMTFSTLAMDGDLKKKVMDDLDSFIGGKEYYKKIGKVWKRGYLLYGPPGTGKSSLIAAMANYLNFNIYSLNLSAVSSDSSLEYLLLHMSNRSILVVEDIDCSIALQNRKAEDHPKDQNQITRPQVTLSGLLNAIDGLLSCCGDERIVVFTTNYKERIDPALLRAGRMDMHINLSYCTFSTFKQLVQSYLDIQDHHLFSEIEKLIKEVQVSPAEVAGELMKFKDPDLCLESLVEFFKKKELEPKSEADQRPGDANSHINPDEKDKVQSSSKKNEADMKDENRVQSSGRKTEMTANGFSIEKEVKSAVGNCTLPHVNYTVKEEFKHIFSSILSKYGDIAANCSLQSVQCRSSFWEIVCGVTGKLKEADSKNMSQFELSSMLSSIQDLESIGMEVGWLRGQLEEISQVTPESQQSKTIEHIAKNIAEPKSCHAEARMLPTKNRTTSSLEAQIPEILDIDTNRWNLQKHR